MNLIANRLYIFTLTKPCPAFHWTHRRYSEGRQVNRSCVSINRRRKGLREWGDYSRKSLNTVWRYLCISQ